MVQAEGVARCSTAERGAAGGEPEVVFRGVARARRRRAGKALEVMPVWSDPQEREISEAGGPSNRCGGPCSGAAPTRRPVACAAILGLALYGAFASPAAARPFNAQEPGYAPLEGGSITIRGSATAWTSRASSLTVPNPGGLGGELLVGVVTARLSGGGSITAPVGWTEVRRDSNIGGAALSQALYIRVVSAFEPSSSR